MVEDSQIDVSSHAMEAIYYGELRMYVITLIYIWVVLNYTTGDKELHVLVVLVTKTWLLCIEIMSYYNYCKLNCLRSGHTMNMPVQKFIGQQAHQAQNLIGPLSLTRERRKCGLLTLP